MCLHGLLIWLTVAAGVSGTGDSELLDRLSRKLNSLRSLPELTPSNARCPDSTETLVGLKIATILDRLGPPDFATRSPLLIGESIASNEALPIPEEAAATWTYFFRSPVPAGRRAGPYPELTFRFDAQDRVIQVSCRYSR